MDDSFDPDLHPAFAEIWAQARPYTMTSAERGFALYQAVNAVLDNDIPGAIVECGVWRGGSAMIAALALKRRGARRPIVLFDTFAGMTEPGTHDVDLHGVPAADLMAGSRGARVAEMVKADSPVEEVRAALASTGYDMRMIRLVEGDVRNTLRRTSTQRIALLRLDTDFYDSTLAELTELWPRLSRGGIFIVDDYGHWQGARQAFEEYFETGSHGYRRPLLWRIDYTGHGGVKLQDRCEPEIERYDYIPDGFEAPDLLRLFPDAVAQDPWQVKWPYLRSHIPHVWRWDRRDDKPWRTGNASVEEAACLYTLARQFAGHRGIEIGTHFGWTAAHLLAAGLELDTVDPELAVPARRAAVSAALDRVEAPGAYRLWGGFSPDLIEEARGAGNGPWSFAFIDGSHDGDAPRDDALAVLPHLAETAVVVFHDLVSPHVERGLYVFHRAGFRTRLYNTMQVLGIAWRGNVTVPQHRADPNVPPFLPFHLNRYDR